MALGVALTFALTIYLTPAFAQSPDTASQELLRQQERALREQQESTPDVRLSRPAQMAPNRLSASETPCFPIQSIHWRLATKWRCG